jgi:hypothetical protein
LLPSRLARFLCAIADNENRIAILSTGRASNWNITERDAGAEKSIFQHLLSLDTVAMSFINFMALGAMNQFEFHAALIMRRAGERQLMHEKLISAQRLLPRPSACLIYGR